ncbi:MAG: DUF4167 domain-containing protein [Mesorhizobium sp.]
MRPQQQNRRMRGRNNNNGGGGGNNNNQNRKGPNPLTRSYESNGPDVKIRGSAHQIAEKYMQLARDAQGSGDRVMAENYLQHAEHYNRIIAAAQAQMPVQVPRDNRDDMDEDEEGEGQPNFDQRQVNDGLGAQPVIEGIPAEVALSEEANGDEQPREERPLNGNQANGQNGEDGAPRRPRRRRGRRADGEGANGEGEAPSADADGAEDSLPAFVTSSRSKQAAPVAAESGDEPQPVDAE